MNPGPDGDLLAAPRWCALAAVIAGLCFACTGCGQKGALYLPDRNGSVVTRPANAPQTQQQAPQTQQQPATPATPATPKKDKDPPN